MSIAPELNLYLGLNFWGSPWVSHIYRVFRFNVQCVFVIFVVYVVAVVVVVVVFSLLNICSSCYDIIMIV